MKKNTAQIVEELKLCPDFKTFYERNEDQMVQEELATMLAKLVEEKGLRKSAVFQKAELSDVYGYQIFSGLRHPERKKLLCLAIGMELSPEETQALLKAAGYAPLYAKQPADCIVLYGLYKKLTIPEINTLLYENELETLG
ncbi:MAG: XRE family transcriptional regulator [Ruminococcaceae bacterium]|nr:XRE family transcriptional regulator [Oscillospiraceae bacterium]